MFLSGLEGANQSMNSEPQFHPSGEFTVKLQRMWCALTNQGSSPGYVSDRRCGGYFFLIAYQSSAQAVPFKGVALHVFS